MLKIKGKMEPHNNCIKIKLVMDENNTFQRPGVEPLSILLKFLAYPIK